MRNLCLALILANLAFAAWQYGRPGRDAASAREQRDVPGIMLVSEYSRGAERRTAPDTAPRPASDSSVDGSATPEGGLDTSTEGSATPADGPDPATEGAATPAGGPDPSTEGSATPADGPAPSADGAGPAADGAADESETADADAAAAEGAAEDAEPGPAEAAQAALRCRSVGPFEELSQATAAAAALRADGFEPSQRAAEGEVWVGYWVYIDAIPTTAEAESMLADLGDAGIPEAYLIAADSGNTISLGVFTELDRAQRLRDDVRELGYGPTVTDRTRQGNVYWVDVRFGPDAALDLENLQPPGRIVRLEQQPCP